VKPIFQAIAAKTEDGTPCCDWVGENGAGHFVKMVHNGIEYGDMQLICEAYDMLRRLVGMSASEMHEVFAEWNRGELDSYLIEITRDILGFKDRGLSRSSTGSSTPRARRARGSGRASRPSSSASRSP
jgi:6-phosphogluconate dehydrogenase